MSNIIINGDLSGSATLQAQDNAGIDTVLTLPVTSGTLVHDKIVDQNILSFASFAAIPSGFRGIARVGSALYVGDGVNLYLASQTVFKSAVPTSLTGSTSATTLGTIIIPGGLLQVNSQIEIRSLWSTTGTGGTKTLGATFGGQSIFGQSFAVGPQSIGTDRVIANRNSLSSQVTMGGWNLPMSSNLTASSSYLTVNTAADVPITFTGTLAAAADSIILEAYSVKILL